MERSTVVQCYKASADLNPGLSLGFQDRQLDFLQPSMLDGIHLATLLCMQMQLMQMQFGRLFFGYTTNVVSSAVFQICLLHQVSDFVYST